MGCCGLVFPDGLHPSDMRQGEAEVGYWIGRPYWGLGLIPEAVAALLARCFGDLRLDAVWCAHYDGNTNSRRVIEKSGFRFHHTNHGVVSPLGDRRTEHFYIMTKEDYRAAGLCPASLHALPRPGAPADGKNGKHAGDGTGTCVV